MRRFVFVLAFVFSLLFCVPPLPSWATAAGPRDAQTVSGTVAAGSTRVDDMPAQLRRPIPPDDVIAALRADHEVLVAALQELGFPPANAGETFSNWATWPASRQLETAYRWAEAGPAPNGGEAFLGAITRKLSEHVDAVRYHPQLLQYLAPNRPAEAVAFARPAPAAAARPLHDHVREVIKAVVMHLSGHELFFAATRCCGLSDAEVFEVMGRSDSYAKALHEIMALKPPPPTPAEKAGELLRAGIEDNPALRMDPSILRLDPLHPNSLKFESGLGSDGVPRLESPDRSSPAAMLPSRRDDGPSAPPVGSTTPSVGPPGSGGGSASAGVPTTGTGTGGGPAHTAESEATQAYRIFEGTEYPERGMRGFDAMVVRSAGFGGVIFGNRVIDPPSHDRAVSVTWLPGPTAPDKSSADTPEAWGQLAFTLAGGRVVTSPMMRLETAVEAMGLVGEHRPSGEGIGLVGFTGRFIALTQAEPPRLVPGFSYVVHPSLLRSRTGRALMMLDTIPQAKQLLLDQVRDSGADAQTLDALDKVLKAEKGQYKFTDTELQVIIDPDGVVRVERPDSPALHASAELRRHAFMTMRTFHEVEKADDVVDEPQPEDAIPIYRLIPVLATVSEPFARANDLAQAFALLRWADRGGATWGNRPTAGPPLPVSTAVVLLGDKDVSFVANVSQAQQSSVQWAADRARSLAGRDESRLRRTDEIAEIGLKLVGAWQHVSEPYTAEPDSFEALSERILAGARVDELVDQVGCIASGRTYDADGNCDGKSVDPHGDQRWFQTVMFIGDLFKPL